MSALPKRPDSEYQNGDFVWADFGPSLLESTENPNEHCFTLAVDAELYRHEHAVAVRAVAALRAIDGEVSLATWEQAFDALREIEASGWVP